MSTSMMRFARVLLALNVMLMTAIPSSAAQRGPALPAPA